MRGGAAHAIVKSYIGRYDNEKHGLLYYVSLRLTRARPLFTGRSGGIILVLVFQGWRSFGVEVHMHITSVRPQQRVLGPPHHPPHQQNVGSLDPQASTRRERPAVRNLTRVPVPFLCVICRHCSVLSLSPAHNCPTDHRPCGEHPSSMLDQGLHRSAPRVPYHPTKLCVWKVRQSISTASAETCKRAMVRCGKPVLAAQGLEDLFSRQLYARGRLRVVHTNPAARPGLLELPNVGSLFEHRNPADCSLVHQPDSVR